MDRTHLVYFHPDKKNGYGACYEDRYIQRLNEQKLDVEKAVIIERGLSLQEASERERLLQQRDGYPLDNSTYEYFLNVVNSKSHTKEVRAKAAANTDWEATVKKRGNYRDNKPEFRHRVKAIRVSDKKIIGIFESQLKAAKELNLHQGSIFQVLKGIIKSTGGYTFEYA